MSRSAQEGGLIAVGGDQVRLMTRVARMYHEQGKRQSEISDELHISQPRVSRLLKRAVEVGIVRTSVFVPPGIYTELEEALEQRFGLEQAVVVDADGAHEDVTPAIGAALADYLSATMTGGDSVGISSWASTLLAGFGALKPFRSPVADHVVQLVGGIGNPRVQMQASRIIGLFQAATGAEPILLPTPAVLGSREAGAALLGDPAVADAVNAWQTLTLALVGIGAIEPSGLALESGNAFPDADRQRLEAKGAVGDICFRFFDAEGNLIDSDFDGRVIGVDPGVLKAVPRRVGAAGGLKKVPAIRGALLGGWINVLVTDRAVAEALL